jgi:hypothetical protein
LPLDVALPSLRFVHHEVTTDLEQLTQRVAPNVLQPRECARMPHKFRETRLYQVAPISTNLILSYVAEHVLGLPRSF